MIIIQKIHPLKTDNIFKRSKSNYKSNGKSNEGYCFNFSSACSFHVGLCNLRGISVCKVSYISWFKFINFITFFYNTSTVLTSLRKVKSFVFLHRLF